MGIITNISTDIDRDDQVKRVFITSKFGVTTRGDLNRIASRASVGLGVGQRTLVAAAYDEEGIDLVWNEGLGRRISPEDKFEEAKMIDYESKPVESASDFGDILPPMLKDRVQFNEFTRGEVLHMWEIPFEVDPV